LVPLLPEPRLLHDGSDVVLNGTCYRLKLLAGDDTRLFVPSRPDELAGGDALRFDTALGVLHELAQVVTEINERLLDPLDGHTNRCVQALLTAPEVSASFKDALRPWAFALFKHGSNVHGERGSVFVPPASREVFLREIQAMPAQGRGQLRWRDFLDHVFDPAPLVTQGFYLFDRPEDRMRFEELLGPEYTTLRRKIGRLFEEAVWEGNAIPAQQWKRFDSLSQEALTRQRDLLEPALANADSEVRSMTSRVRIRCYEGGAFRFLVRPYSYEFAPELDRCATLLDRARAELPPRAMELREVLADLADWCRVRTDAPAWGEALPSWVAASDRACLLDVNLTAEEKVSRLGAKGGLQLAVTAFEVVPDALRPILRMLQKPGDGPELNVVWLKHLLVGGGASNAIMAGEKLPDPDGRSRYKVMTFTNAVRSSMVESNAQLIAAATSFGLEDIPRLADAANLLVLLHEVGHTLGDFAEYLGDLGASVEETNAEASVLYLARRMAPDSLVDLIGLTACWTPVLRTLQGPAEAHSHSDIVLFDEVLRAGGVACGERGGAAIVVPGSPEEAVRAAFALALRMRLWELGVPSARQQAWLEPFDAGDEAQDTRILQRAREAVESLEEEIRQAWREEVLTECRAFFAPARLEQLAQPLHRVIDRLPRFQPQTVIPTDDRFRLVLSVP